jgi:microcystin degradation protein MlrC
MRIATGGILHETSTLVDGTTSLADFANGYGVYRGQELIDRFRDANMCPGGFISGAEKHGFELVPLLWGFAYPGGRVSRDAYETLKTELIIRYRLAIDDGGPIDGILLDLHGSMVVEGIDDGEGDLIAALREVVGPNCPIVVTTDLHSNHSARRVEQSDAIIGYDTFPHVDMAERGREAADLIVRAVRGEVQLRQAIQPVSMFWSTPCQVTGKEPFDEVIARVHAMEQRPGILSITLSTGFAWADVPDVGVSVICVADGDRQLAQTTATELADWLYEHRERFYAPPLAVREALARGEAMGKYPIMLADHADNTGGGSPGDSTEVLQTFLDLDLQEALLLYLVDPEFIAAAQAAGVGSTIGLPLGGKSSPVQGAPVAGPWQVLATSHGAFTYDGPMYAGLTGNMGESVWVRRQGVNVVVVTNREQPLGPAFAKSLGIDVEGMRYIAVKSAAHFRAAFEKFAGSIFNVDAAGIHDHDLRRIAYQKRKRPMFPIEIRPGE